MSSRYLPPMGSKAPCRKAIEKPPRLVSFLASPRPHERTAQDPAGDGSTHRVLFKYADGILSAANPSCVFCLDDCANLVDGFNILFRPFRNRIEPRRHHKTLQPLWRTDLAAILHRACKVCITCPIGATRNLIEPRLVEFLVCLNKRRSLATVRLKPCNIKVVAIVPVALQNAFRHTLVELVGMIPYVITPNPWTHPRLLRLLHEPQEIMPPQITLPDHAIPMTPVIVR